MRTFDRTCKHVCSAAALLLSVLAPTVASADGYYEPPLPTAPVLMNWSGFYIGGQIGGGWGNVDWTQNNVNDFSPAIGSSTSFDTGGFMGGIIGGGNVQLDRWVFGIELAFNGTGVTKSQASNLVATDTFKSELNWLTTITGRIGYTWNNWLVFGRGGWAGGEIKQTLSSGAVTASHESFVDGWTIGGGFDVMAWPNIVFGLTYDYVTLNHGTEIVSCPACVVATPSLESDTTMSMIMARATYFVPMDDY